jgi:hypothetical protein
MNTFEFEFKKSLEFDLSKADKKNKEVPGPVLHSEKRDLQNEIYSHEVVKEAMTGYIENYRIMGIMHKNLADAVPIQNFIDGSGSWIMSAKCKSDELWDRIDKGELTGFSIGGQAAGYWEDEGKTKKRLTKMIVKEISFVDKAANGSVFYPIYKRLEEGGENMEDKLKEAIEKSENALKEANKRIAEQGQELTELKKKYSVNETKETEFETKLKGLQDLVNKKSEEAVSNERIVKVEKSLCDLIDVVKNLVENTDELNVNLSKAKTPKSNVSDGRFMRNSNKSDEQETDLMKAMKSINDDNKLWSDQEMRFQLLAKGINPEQQCSRDAKKIFGK